MELLAASLPAARSPVLGHSDSKETTVYRSPNSQVPACTRFIEEGIRELLKARRILCGSYVYGNRFIRIVNFVLEMNSFENNRVLSGR